MIDKWDNRAAAFFASFSFVLATLGTNVRSPSLLPTLSPAAYSCQFAMVDLSKLSLSRKRHVSPLSTLHQHTKRPDYMCFHWRVGVMSLGDISERYWVFIVYEWVYGVFGTDCGDYDCRCEFSIMFRVCEGWLFIWVVLACASGECGCSVYV